MLVIIWVIRKMAAVINMSAVFIASAASMWSVRMLGTIAIRLNVSI